MKRIISTLVCLALILCLGCVATAEEYPPLTIRLMTIKHSTAPISNEMLTIQALAEKFNVTFEFELIAEQDYDEKLNTILAGGSMPDVFFAKPSTMSQYYDAGIVRVLDDLLAQYAPNILEQWEAHDLLRNVKSDDGHYYYTTYIDESSSMECCGWINKTLLDECNLEIPTSYDELYEVLKIFKDTYGEGFIPLAQGPWYYVDKPIYYAFGTFNGWIYLNDTDGYVYGPYAYAEETKAALTWMNKCYEEGLLDAEYLTRSADDINALCAENKIGYMNTWADHAAVVAEGGSYGVNYVPIPVLDNTLGTAKYVGNKSATGTPMYISSDASDEVVQRWLEIVNYIYSEEGIMLFDWGIEGDTYEMVDGVPQLTAKVLESDLGELNGRRSFGMEPQNFPHLATWEGWSAVLWDCTVDVTNANADYVLPQNPNLTGTFEEESELANIMGDIENLTKTSLEQFITGAKDIETEWDAYIADLEKMGIERASEIQAAKFQRWLAR